MPLKVELSALLAGTLAATVVSFCIWKYRKLEKVFVKVGRVKSLCLYPIKTLKGIEVPELECTPFGVKYFDVLDRSFMLVSDDGNLVSQYHDPKLILLSVSMFQDHIVVTNLDGRTLKINLSDNLGNTEGTKHNLHLSPAQTIDCGDEAAEFFQDFLGRENVRLVRFTPEVPTRWSLRSNPIFKKLIGSSVSIREDYSTMNIASQSSLEDLNSRLEKKISMQNFRTNVVIEDAPAFDEDNWALVKFSNGVVVNEVIPNGRCIVITNDPNTGIKTNKEPLMTLRKFRMPKDKKLLKALEYAPMFALHGSLQKSGKIAVGDEVFAVIEKGKFACRE